MNELIKPIDDIIMNTSLPSIFGETLSLQEDRLFVLTHYKKAVWASKSSQ